MSQYFLHDGSNESGPFSFEELRSKKISRSINVWREGMDTWAPAASLPELHELFSTPPAFNQSSPVFNQNVNPVKTTTAFRFGKRVGYALVATAIIVVLVIAGSTIYHYMQEKSYSEIKRTHELIKNNEEDQKKFIRENITSYVTAERNNYTYSELGGIFGLRITVLNTSKYLMNEVKVKINYHKPNGDIWDNKIIDFYFIKPETKITLPVEDTDRGVRVTYEIISIKSTALDL